MRQRRYGIGILLLCLLLVPLQASAQSAAFASIGTLNADAFPIIDAYLDFHDGQGNFVHNLGVEQVKVLENNTPVRDIQLNELRPGAQIVVALNPGLSFGIRNNQGVSRYDILKEHLINWSGNRRGSSIDDWSLLITDGPGISHVADPAEWQATLQADQTNAREATPSMDTLLRAIDLASDPTPRKGMGRAVLFITPSPEGIQNQTLENITIQAQQQGVVIFVWLVSSAGAFPTTGVEQLRDLVMATSGQFFAYTGTEFLPDPEIYLEPLRYIYHLSYQSAVTSSGTHQVAVQIDHEGGLIETAPQVFTIEILPPLPAIISPPIQILRKPVAGTESSAEGKNAQPAYTPSEHPLQIVVDFPDGRIRPLEYSALLVNGILAAENLSPPFDQFIWNIDSYLADGVHNIQVQVRDSFGLVGSSAELPVQITIEQIKPNPWNLLQHNIGTIAILVVLLAGAVLLMVLIIGGRIKPRSMRALRRRKQLSDPVTQPVQPDTEMEGRQHQTRGQRLHWLQRGTARSSMPKAHAFLTPITDDENQPGPPIPITAKETLFGSDTKQVSVALTHPSIEPVHATLTRTESGNFKLADHGSTAGTWINYSPVSRGGSILEHGDVTHFGKVGFRFTMRQPTRVRKPVISYLRPLEGKEEETP